MPKNSDGYQGNCEVLDEKTPTLKIEGEAFYLHCGIPTGGLEYKANVKGKGIISIYSVKNNDTYELNDKELELLEHIKVDDEELCGGWGEKIMGIKIVYNGNIEIKDIELRKVK
ncbi:hypothetical protein [Pseudobutyrivibrio ruminis]|uniref:hypothetical protein n=1 Tax=Pseudobutyrivibrio ruminis TaxID=46206 RepID=UPI0012DFBF1B|nr:hypothetical protein [Pseudobutyrivibrio ruminis]